MFVLSLLKRPLFRLFFPPVAGLLFYGGWAFLINMEYGQMIALRAAVAQGGYSFAVTLTLALLVEHLFHRFSSVTGGAIYTGFIACILLYVSSWCINAFAQTPNILLTMLPGALVSTCYTCLYIVALHKVN